jgi:hypothetical protein
MNHDNANAQLHADTLDCEFLPPLDARETWGVAWERQLAAAIAWQEAGGNDDAWIEAPAEVVVPALEDATPPSWRSRSELAATGYPALNMGTIVRMNTLLVSLRERMLQITSEASNIAIAEMALRHDARSERGEGSCGSQQPLHPAHAERIKELAGAWFGILGEAQRSMSALTGLDAGDREPSTRPVAANETHPDTERRHHERAIDFPDRRRSGT